jgi:glucan biosynthesis protein C
MQRRYDIDWLRVFATYVLFIFHVGMVFNPAPFYHVRNADLSFAMLVMCGFIGLWHMPLFFLLAGWSAPGSLRQRGGAGFLRERVYKLGLPLVVGCLLFGPPIKYLELKSGLDLSAAGLRVSPEWQASFRTVIPQGLALAPPFTESYLAFLPTYFTLARFTWMHLWFLAYLFTFSLLYQPLFAWLARRRDLLPNAGALWLYVPIVPLAVIQLTLRERWPGVQNLYDDWANVAYYSTYLLAGAVLASSSALERAAEREWRRALVLGLATTLLLLVAVLGLLPPRMVLLAGSAAGGWCLVLAFVGAARRFLSFGTRGLTYLAASAFPVYVLHQAAIVIPGYFIVQLPLGIAAKLVLLLATAVALTLGVYHFVVRRFAVVAVLFAAHRPMRRPQRAATPHAPATALCVPEVSR